MSPQSDSVSEPLFEIGVSNFGHDLEITSVSANKEQIETFSAPIRKLSCCVWSPMEKG